MSFYKNKNILVTGGTGLIGVPVVKSLVEKGANVTVASLDSEERASKVLPQEAVFIKCDLTDYKSCEKICSKKDLVFHLAGIKGSVSLGRSRAATFFVPHILFNTNMMQAAFSCGVERYLYTSSIGVYPEAKIFLEDDAWNGPPFSVDVFPGWAKRMGELQAEAYKIEHGWDKIAIVRPANVYGPYDNFDPETAMVVPSLINKFANRKDKVEIWGDGSAIRDLIYSEDVAEGMLKALEYGANCLPFNLGTGIGCSVKDLALAIAEFFDLGEDVLSFNTSKPSGESIRVMDVTRAETMIGFEAKTNIKEGIKKTIEWYLNNVDLANNRYNVFKEQK